MRNCSEVTNGENDADNKREIAFKLTVFSPVGLTNSKLNPMSWRYIKGNLL